MRQWPAGLFLLFGCSSGPKDLESSEGSNEAAPSADVEALSAEIEAEFPAPQAGGDEEAAPVSLVLEFEGLGALHKSFFADERVTSELQSKLQGHLTGAVGIVVSYDSRRGQGGIRIQAEAGQLNRPIGGPSTLDFSALLPLSTTVAFYRDWVASNFDFRVQNFAVSVELTRGSSVCSFRPSGSPPPDGTQIDPCLEAGGEEVCGTLTDTMLSVPAAHHKAVERCL